MIDARAGEPFTATLDGASPGQVGVVGYTIENLAGDIIIARVATGIIEAPASSGIYIASVPAAPSDDGTYLLAWDTGGLDPRYASEELRVAPAPASDNDAIATLAELRAFEPLDDADRYPDPAVLAVRDAVIEALERACRTSFVRRTFTETFADSIRRSKLDLNQRRDPELTALTRNGTDLDDTELAALRVAGGLISRPWGDFGHTAAVTYTAGYATPPGRVARAVCMLTRDWIVENVDDAIPSRATSWQAGDNTYRLVTAGVAGALFDLPEANAIVKAYRE